MTSTKTIVITIFVLLFLGVLFLTSNIQNAYKMLPIKESKKMEVPSYAEWREFTANTGRFRVMVPMPPQYAKDAVEIAGTDKKRLYEMYVSEKINGTIFMISLITYPSEVDTSNVDQILEETVHEMVATNPQNELRDFKDETFRGHKAVNFEIANHEFHVEGEAFMVDKTLYLLTYVAKTEDYNEADYQYFIRSFELLNP